MSAINTRPTNFDRLLALGAVVLTLVVAAALIRGRAHWPAVSPLIWAHIGTVILATVLTPAMLLRQRGNPLHRQTGYLWAGTMFITALLSLGIRVINHGSLSLIHILSVVTLIGVPRLIWAARQQPDRRSSPRGADHRFAGAADGGTVHVPVWADAGDLALRIRGANLHGGEPSGWAGFQRRTAMPAGAKRRDPNSSSPARPAGSSTGLAE